MYTDYDNISSDLEERLEDLAYHSEHLMVGVVREIDFKENEDFNKAVRHPLETHEIELLEKQIRQINWSDVDTDKPEMDQDILYRGSIYYVIQEYLESWVKENTSDE